MARVESEAGIIATLIHHPEFSYYSEQLLPNHFTNEENRYIYQAICSLARDGITTIDPYNIIQALSAKEATRRFADELSIDQLYTLMDNSDSIARNTVEEYKLLVNNVMDAAFRRDTFQQLKECQKLCTQPSEENIEQKIYKMLDDVMMEFSATNEVPPYKDVVDKCWEEIKGRQGAGYAGIPFKFPALNDYATIERGELFIFGAEQKQGKSMMLLNCAVDLLKQDYAVLYLDSELNTRLFTSRILAHLSGIEYKRLTSGNYSDEEEKRILDAKEWLKTRKFTHIYIPMFDQQSIFTAVNKVKHTVRHIIQRNVEKGLLPNYQDGAVEMDKQYCTMGILGLYEVIEAFGYTKTDEFGYISYTDEGIAFASKIFEVLNEVKDNFTDAYSFNIESVPAERAAVILCQKDNVLYDHNDKFIYSNQWIPLSAKCTIQEKLRLSSILDEKCSGGSIAHINLESNFPNTETAWKMLNKIAQAGVIYFAFNTRINECKNHHGFVGTDHCPVCGEPVFDTYQRIVGYLVPSRAYSKDRFREFNTRQWYSYAEAMSE